MPASLCGSSTSGSFDAWIKSGKICGMSGKPIGKAQVYRLIDGRSAGNVDKTTGKRTPASPTGDCRRQSVTRHPTVTERSTQSEPPTPDVSDLADLKAAVRDLSPPDFAAFKAWFRGYCGA